MTDKAVPRTLLDRIWDAHVVARLPGADLLYVDLHSPQAFAALHAAGRVVRRPGAAIAIPDHGPQQLDVREPAQRPCDGDSSTGRAAAAPGSASPA
jgi:3-isopropylmalate/(R)-2-methylmalate dehydratase large subunit